MQGFKTLMAPVVLPMPVNGKGKVLATSAGGEKKYDLMYYLKGALAGGICCSITHGALCPVDVVKTKIQLDPVKYNKGLIGGFGQVIAEEGIGGLATGLGPTVVGYFVQGD
jgi:solute carrier family 25 phosphate transporter 3